MFEGKIKQFYLGQARAHMLGVVDNSRGTREFPDARMTYTNMMGQEVVDVEVRPELVGEVAKHLGSRSPGRVALIEIGRASCRERVYLAV